MNTEPNGIMLTCDHKYPLSAMIGIIDPLRASADRESWECVEELRETLNGKILRLVELNHPYAGRVRDLFTQHGCDPAQSFSHHGKNVIHLLHEVKQGIFILTDEIEERFTAKKLVPFQKPITDIPVEGTEELDLAA